ncbi:MAG: hypothetical protein NTX65_05925 [Ignavibacteriales bacterium]|nr:hypothetical protein [Ignavibacteriales bacterium]
MPTLHRIQFRFQINLFALILISAISLTYKVSMAQSINPSAKGKSDFVSQDEKEFKKIKQLKVKSRIKYAVYNDVKGYMNDKKVLIGKEVFNKRGSLLEMEEYNSSGNMISSYKFSYNSKGKPIKAEGIDDADRKSIQFSKYDSRGNETERNLISIARKRTESKSLFKYDKDNNLVEVKNYIDGNFNDQQNTEFKNGVRIRTTMLNEKKDTVLVSIPEYNSAGKLVSEKSKNQNTVYKYDSNGNLNEMVDAEFKRVYVSDEKGNIVEHKMFLLDGRRQIRLVFKYNQKGLMSDWIRYDNNEDVVLHYAYEYEYYK